MVAFSASASQSIPDKYTESVLYDRPREVVPGVWSSIGATGPPTYENAGHNNNLSFVVTSDGVLVVNGGACYLLASALHEEIRKVTTQPVKLVVNENGQGHAMLGNSYWAEQGVPIIMHADAAAEVVEHGLDILARMERYNKDRSKSTQVVEPTETFQDRKVIQMGDTRIELIWFGPAHSPGDISVWLPEQDLIITGDMAFHQRVLPIFEDTITSGWLESWEKFAAMKVTHIIPGHGEPTNMAEVTRYTRDYLVYLRGKVRTLLDAGGTLKDAYAIDQSPYAHLDTYNELARRNAERVFREMEFD
jgi:glyoxylase-like metal-dependent hydrolase (beta-lactamase superfamily II)